MAAEIKEVTINSLPVTGSELRTRLDHYDEMLHAILLIVQDLADVATPEVRAMLRRFLDNPAMRWKKRTSDVRRQDQ